MKKRFRYIVMICMLCMTSCTKLHPSEIDSFIDHYLSVDISEQIQYNNRTDQRMTFYSNADEVKKAYAKQIEESCKEMNEEEIDTQIKDFFDFYQRQNETMATMSKQLSYEEISKHTMKKIPTDIILYFEINEDAYDKTNNDSLIFYEGNMARLKINGDEIYYKVYSHKAEEILDFMVEDNQSFLGSEKKPCFYDYDWSDMQTKKDG